MAQIVSITEARAMRAGQVDSILPPTRSDLYDRLAATRLTGTACKLLLHLIRLSGGAPVEVGYKPLAEAVACGYRTAVRVVQALEDDGFIKVHRHRVGLVNATNRIEINFNGPLGVPVGFLKTPKTKNWGTAKMAQGVLPKGSGKDKSYKAKTNNLKVIGHAERPRFDTAVEAIKASGQQTSAARERKVLRPAKSQLTFGGVKAIWSTVMLKHYPRVPAVMFSAKDFAIFKAKVAPILRTANLSEFFEFVIEGWRSLRETKFVWLRVKGKDIAVAPSLPELMRYFRVFAQAFSDHQMGVTSNADKARRTAVEDAEDRIAEERDARARAEAENAKLREKLLRAERMTGRSENWDDRPKESLTVRRKRAESTYNEPADIPEWKSDDEG